MTDGQSPRETLVARLLTQHDALPTTAATTPHPDDDTLALFAEGHLPAAERIALVAHLADCGECRAKTGLLLKATGDDVQPVETVCLTIPIYRRWPVQVMALAAGLMICVGLYWLFDVRQQRLAENSAFTRARQLLIDGRFDEAEVELSRARDRQVRSARLDNLAAQAWRRIPSAIALSTSGRLTDLGVGIGGVVAREPPPLPAADTERVQQLLDTAAQQDLNAALNRAHLLLSLNQPQAALDQLHKLVPEHPKNPWVWLGLGNGHYLLGDFESAAEAYANCLKLDDDNMSAQMNLAMTLEEQGKLATARKAWESLLADHGTRLTEDERNQIEAQVRALRELPE